MWTLTLVVSDVHDKPASSCQAVRKVGKFDSENKTEGDPGESKEPEKVLDEHDAALILCVPLELVMEIKKLIGLFSLENVKKALKVAERDI